MEEAIFRNGSKTYYRASKLFPPHVREDVAKLYSFVRVADNFVDSTPQDKKAFERLAGFWQQYRDADEYEALRKGDDSQWVTANMLDVVRAHKMDPAWVDAFLHSMRLDTRKKKYRTADELRTYIYGSAEVIGLMMARLMQLPDDADHAARQQGAAMQLINFIRDIREDVALGRQYLPINEMKRAGLQGISEEQAHAQPKEFEEFIHLQIARYHHWQHEASEGFGYMPKKQRRAVRVAVDGYNWTARKIAKKPLRVYKKQLKPPKWYLWWRSLVRTVFG